MKLLVRIKNVSFILGIKGLFGQPNISDLFCAVFVSPPVLAGELLLIVNFLISMRGALENLRKSIKLKSTSP